MTDFNREAAAAAKRKVESQTHIPDEIHDVGLSLEAIGLYTRWLSHYQQGSLEGIAQAAGYENLTRETLIAIQDLRNSGVMPDNYKYFAGHDAEVLAECWYITAPAQDA